MPGKSRGQLKFPVIPRYAIFKVARGWGVSPGSFGLVVFFHYSSADIKICTVFLFIKKGCPGWGVSPGSLDFVYFIIPSLNR
jgi:hypothetical protein